MEISVENGALSSLSDEELVSHCRGGVQDAFGELSVRCISIIRSNASGLYDMGVEADDLFQEGLIGLNDAVRSYREDGGASFRTYAAACIRNRMVSAVRKANSKRHLILNRTLPLEEEVDLRSAPETEPESAFEVDETMRELTKQITESLTKLEMSVMLLYVDGKSYDEIAAALGITRKSCDSAMQRVRRKLKAFK